MGMYTLYIHHGEAPWWVYTTLYIHRREAYTERREALRTPWVYKGEKRGSQDPSGKEKKKEREALRTLWEGEKR